ncbi:MAG: CDP-alcohol phosphatidyltransferase-domain-containing protein [Benjaminiella poitrasii]|nr:MAG: CDP-alcohol phosphatidyltransferase-domain-containing protein [Benjaminiella poitrasii]
MLRLSRHHQVRSICFITKTISIRSSFRNNQLVFRPLIYKNKNQWVNSVIPCNNHVFKTCTWMSVQRTFISNTKPKSLLTRKEGDCGKANTSTPKKELKENIYTIPNVLTFGRLLTAPCIGYLILQHNYDIALGLFALAGFTDLLDGHIARKYNMKTLLGTIIDPLADKVLMTVMTITLTMQGTLPMPLATVILGRDAGLIISAFYYRYISLPEPKTIARYFDGSIPSAEVKPTQISKLNTALQLVLMGASLTSLSVGVPSSDILTALQ